MTYSLVEILKIIEGCTGLTDCKTLKTLIYVVDEDRDQFRSDEIEYIQKQLNYQMKKILKINGHQLPETSRELLNSLING